MLETQGFFYTGDFMRLNIPQEIKSRVSMGDVLTRYGFENKKRIPCPLHGGKNNNFEVKEHSYICYSQCGGGDVITFVQKLFDLSFQDALKKIDLDFSLGLFGAHSFEEVRQSYYKQQAAKAKRERESREKQNEVDEYWRIFDEWKRLSDNKKKYAPKDPDEQLHPLFVEALQNLEYQEYLLDCAEERRYSNV